MRFLLVIALAISCWPAHAVDQQLSFAGEQYQRAAEGGKGGKRLVEFVRSRETLENWTKLVGIHEFPDSKLSPGEMVGQMVRTIKSQHPDARIRVSESPTTREVMIDFLVGTARSEIVEFNVFKYSHHPSGAGLLALQFAQRFKLGEVTGSQLRDIRTRALEETAAFRL